MSGIKDRYDLLLKFSEAKYVHSCLEENYLYFNSLQYFRELESDGLQADPNEGVCNVINKKSTGVPLGNISQNGIEVAKLASLSLSEIDHKPVHICCFYVFSGFKSKVALIKEDIDESVKATFGDRCMIVRDAKGLLRAVHESILKEGLSVKSKQVKYLDLAKHNGLVGPFVKDLKYSVLKEFRLAIFGLPNNEPYRLNIPSLKDYIVDFPTSDIDDMSIEWN